MLERPVAQAAGPPNMVVASLSGLALRLVGVAATFALGLLLARLLGPAEYGLYGLVVTASFVLSSLATLGTPQLAVREISVRIGRGDRAGVRTAALQFLRIGLAASLLLAAAAILLGTAIGARGADLLLIALGAVLMVGTALGTILAAELRALGRLSQGQVFETAGRPLLALALLLGLLLFSVRLDAGTALTVQAASGALAVGVSLLWLRQALPLPTGQLAPAIPWVGAALPLCAATFLAKLDGAYALILLGPLGSDVELGIFRVALACVTLVGMPATVLHVVLAPRLAELVARDDRAELSGLLWRVSLVLLGCMIPGTLLIALWGEPLLTLAFGAPYAPAATPLLLLAIAQTLFAAFGMGPILLAMGGGERTLIRIYLVAVGAGMLSAVPLIILFGASGAASAQIVSLGLIGTHCWFFARRRWGVDLTCFGLVRPQLS